MLSLWLAVRKRVPGLEFIAAALVAGLFTLLWRCHSWRERLLLPWHFALDLFWRLPPAPAEWAELRLSFCRKCPLFYPPLQTCGSPFMALPGEFIFTFLADPHPGCWCHMPTKVRRKENGWLYDRSRGRTRHCWPKHLNSFPFSNHG